MVTPRQLVIAVPVSQLSVAVPRSVSRASSSASQSATSPWWALFEGSETTVPLEHSPTERPTSTTGQSGALRSLTGRAPVIARTR